MREESTGSDRLEGKEVDLVNADRIVNILIDNEVSIGTSESVTAGGVAHALTTVPGSSKVVKGGIMCYSREVKEKILGIPAEFLNRHGTVSEETTKALAKAVQELLNVDIGFGITGNAGPSTDDDTSMVGKVIMALYSRAGESIVKSRELFGEREVIRDKAVTESLRMIREFVLDNYVHGGK